jgi:hypothetical protein
MVARHAFGLAEPGDSSPTSEQEIWTDWPIRRYRQPPTCWKPSQRQPVSVLLPAKCNGCACHGCIVRSAVTQSHVTAKMRTCELVQSRLSLECVESNTYDVGSYSSGRHHIFDIIAVQIVNNQISLICYLAEYNPGLWTDSTKPLKINHQFISRFSIHCRPDSLTAD